MAGVSQNGEFRLPTQLPADDDDLFTDKTEFNGSPKSLLSSGFESFGFTSAPSSTESESDQEDYLDGLTRQMARSTLEDDFSGKNENTKEPYVGGFNNSKGLLGPQVEKPSRFFHPQQKLGSTTQFQQNQLMKPHNAQVWGDNKPRHVVLQNNVSGCNNNNNRPLGVAWRPVQQQPKQQNGSGMRAVFSGNPNGKSECAGTGFFMPRHIATPATARPRKKKARSTVSVPARAVGALNLNLNTINAQVRPRVKPSVATDGGCVSRLGNDGSGFANPKQRKSRSEQGSSHEIRLPQEWTY